MTISDFIAGIGGIISLFIGLSFLSLFEIFDFFIEIFTNLIKHGNNS